MVSPGGGRADYRVLLGRGMKPGEVRRANQRAVMLIAAREPGLSNAELARRSGLAPQTVSAVIADLEQAGLLSRGEVLRGRRGQPATPIFISPTGSFAVGAEIGWTHIELVVINMAGDRLGHYRRDYAYPDATTIFDELADNIQALLAPLSAAERLRVVGIGLAAPSGIGDPSSLMRLPAAQEKLWQTIDIGVQASRATGLDVMLFNDGNAASWAEFGAHPDPRPASFAYLLVDTFLGCGIVAQNRLWEGPNRGSANLGAMLVTDGHGTRRFVHEVASLYALDRRLAEAGTDRAAALGGDGRAASVLQQWIDDAALALAETLVNAASVIEIEAAFLETALPRTVTERLVAATVREIERVPRLGENRPQLRIGHAGGMAAALGAAQLRLYRRWFSRDLEFMDS